MKKGQTKDGQEHQMQALRVSLLPKGVRVDNLEGREHVVVPMVILTEGVHSGTGGALYYPEEELSKTPEVWDHKPVVVYHPTMNGVPISACSPTIVNSRKVGVMMNTRWESGRLKSEAWVERSRADAVDERIMQAVEAGEMMELSTGLFTDNEQADGEWNGESYGAIARNFRPDHLALLPDQIGACSIQDGAGFLRNNNAVPVDKRGQLAEEIGKVLQKFGLTSNAMSFSNIRDSLSALLRQRLVSAKPASQTSGAVPVPEPYPYIEDVYPDFFIYEVSGKLYRLPYETADTGVSIPADASPVLVVRVTEYRTEAGAFVGNKTKDDMNKTQMIDAILANSKVWKKDDRKTLEAMTEQQLGTIHNEATSATEEGATPEGAAAEGAGGSTPTGNAAPPVQPAAPKPVAPVPPKRLATLAEFLDGAPSEVRAVLNEGMDALNAEKAKLVQQLMAVPTNPFAETDLNNMPLANLRNLVALAGPQRADSEGGPTIDYSGQGVAPTGNAGEEPLEMPAATFTA